MKDTALHIPILGRGDKVKRIIILLGLMIISCEKSYHNPDDPTKLNYWVNYYIHGTIFRNNVFPPPAPPTSIVASNGTTHLVFYLNTATTSAYLLARNTSANSFIAMSALPEGITLNSSTGVFSGTPTSLLSPTQINFMVCNSVGCATAEFTVRVINVRGTRVYGQGGDFTTSTSNKGGISADSLASPGSVVVDSSGGVYIADNGNGRVLFYSGGSTTATRVYGQGGSFTTATSGTSSTTFGFSLIVLALDSSGGLYVGDSSNHRVLYFPPGVTTASQVYLQGGNFMTSNFGTTASAITTVSAIAIDSSGGLYIANENRVLYFPAGSYNTATRVYGQLGSFTSNTTNKNGLTADSLSGVSGLSVDPAGGLYVADSGNSRVLYFRDSTSTTATQVYGSSGFTGGTNIDMTSLSDLLNVFGDASGVYVSKKGKVIYFPKDEKSHILTYGGETGAVSLTETSISPFSSNISIFVGTDGKVFISDSASHRVLMY